MEEPWYITHALATGHTTVRDPRKGTRCLGCNALSPESGITVSSPQTRYSLSSEASLVGQRSSAVSSAMSSGGAVADSSDSEQTMLGVVTPDCAGDHDFQMVVALTGELVQIFCTSCGAAWKCEPL